MMMHGLANFKLCQIILRIICTRRKICEFPEDGQQLRPKHVREIIRK